MDILDWIAQVVSRIPDPGEQWLRYDGWYSNASRGKRRQREVSVPVEDEVQDSPQNDSSLAVIQEISLKVTVSRLS